VREEGPIPGGNLPVAPVDSSDRVPQADVKITTLIRNSAVNLGVAGPLRALRAAVLIALCCAAPTAVRCPASDDAASVDAAEHERAIRMQRFMVSATRISKNPWRYAAVDGFEVLSRAPEEATDWWLDSIRLGVAVENQVVPRDWLPESPVPNTVIIDDTDLSTVPDSQIRSQSIVFQSPDDALAWGRLSGKAAVWTDRFEAHDQDTYAVNSDVYGVDMTTPACVVGLVRMSNCAPPLPRWLVAGLLGKECGVFREGVMANVDDHRAGWIQGAEGPGTIWLSLGETQRLLKLLGKDSKTKVAMLPLQRLFGENPVPEADRALWASEAGLFARWGLMGPGREDPATSRAFLELVRRARREPVNERLFTECFGFGYPAMEQRLESFLKAVLAKPTSMELNIPPDSSEPELRDATADQIGRILGDWLRMQGISLRAADAELSREFLDSAGRMLERAYREDNGLPPDVDPARGGERHAAQARGTASGPAVVMKPFVVSATRIHDPRLLSVYGLYEHAIGDDAKARELLEAAARQGVVRPMAYIALAEIRLALARAAPKGAGGRMDSQQAASVLGPVRTALAQNSSPEPYRLIVETWENCDAKPDSEDIEDMVRGVALFPRYTALAYHSALVCAKSGHAAQAGDLIRNGILFSNRESSRRYFEQLRSSLDASAASNAKAPGKE
jgi:hypothetical protein